MARPRKPTALLELSGAFKKNPARAKERAGEPKGNPEIGEPPAEFLRPESPSAAKLLALWHRFLAEAPPGCITGSDRTLLANACRLQAEIERGAGTPAMHSQMNRYLGQMGMTGEGRARRGIAQKKDPEGESDSSGWAAFARESKEARAN